MESPLTYIELYLYTDGIRRLHNRVANMKSFAEVFAETQGKHFDLVMICNRCVVGHW